MLIGNRHFSLVVVRKPIRSLRLHLADAQTIQVSAPAAASPSLINQFVSDNSVWILKHAVGLKLAPSLLTLTHLSIVGELYQIDLMSAPRDSLVIIDHQINIHTSVMSQKHLEKLLNTKLKPFALKIIKKEIADLSEKFSFKPGKITVRNQRSRFGSCSSSGNLSFNWQIIFFPPIEFRHILFHEIAHLTYHHHQKKFWQLLAFYDPEWRVHHRWVKKEGTSHFLIKP